MFQLFLVVLDVGNNISNDFENPIMGLGGGNGLIHFVGVCWNCNKIL